MSFVYIQIFVKLLKIHLHALTPLTQTVASNVQLSSGVVRHVCVDLITQHLLERRIGKKESAQTSGQHMAQVTAYNVVPDASQSAVYAL
jgi:hypothetical protein